MKQNLFKSPFLVFEGPDGSGQSTQLEKLRVYLKNKGWTVAATKEPTPWTKAGMKIREALDEKRKIAPLKLQELFCEDRRDHLKKEIIPALKSGMTVICDRYIFSTIAFGGLDTPMEKLIKMNKDFIWPDKIFYLRVRPEECIRRIEQRGEGVKYFEKLEKLQRVAQNYEKIIKRFSHKVVVLDGEQSIEKIHQQVIASLK